MAFSQVTVTGDYGSGTTGTLTFLLQQPMMNEGSTSVPQLVTVTLDSTGSFSQVFDANGDASTYPAGIWYNVTEAIDGAPFADYAVHIPAIQVETNGSIASSDLSVVQLSTATASEDMIGQSVSGTGIQSGTVVQSVQLPIPLQEIDNYPFTPGTNTVTLSQPATAAGSKLTLTFGSSIDISYLRPAALGWA